LFDALAAAYVRNRANETGEVAILLQNSTNTHLYRLDMPLCFHSVLPGEQGDSQFLPSQAANGANVFIRSYNICPPICMLQRFASNSHASELLSKPLRVWALYGTPVLLLFDWIRMGLRLRTIWFD
jgi:hypothetical protein